MFPKRLCLSTKRHCVSSHNNDILLFTDMRTALLIVISYMVYVFLCTYVPAYWYVLPYVCMYVRRYVYVYVITIALTILPCFFLIFLTSTYGRFTRTVPPSFIYKLGITFSASSFISLSLFHVLL